MNKGLMLDRVVLLGRTLDEYQRYFDLHPEAMRGKRILDVASGVSSFRADASALGLDVTACDPIYELSPEEIGPRCETDLDHVVNAVRGLRTYCWDFYETPERLRTFREHAFRTFLTDFAANGRSHYVPGSLPSLPFPDRAFDLTLVSYFLFVYERQFDYEFHRQAILEVIRVTRDEARIYPVVTFEAERSAHLVRLETDPALRSLIFEEVKTDFEFLRNSNFYLRVTRRS